MNYLVVYDVTKTSPEWWFPALGVGFVAIGVVQWVRRARSPGFVATVFRALWLAFAVFWTTCAGFIIFTGHARMQRELSEGRASVVEGQVHDFHPMSSAPRDTEHFTVDAVPFSYADNVIGHGFHQTNAHGGPIREGLAVRIHYSGKNILKLEIAQ